MPQQYPFYKNLYFPQKRMRAVDFIRDQEFADGKLAFLTHWLLGEGAAAGLSVQRVRHDALMVHPGFAVDPRGRYVIVEKMKVCSLTQLKGLDKLKSGNAVLWLRYEEEPQSPMLVEEGGQEVERKAVARESCDFFLTDAASLPPPAGERALFSNFVLFQDDDLRLTQSIPRLIPANGWVTARLIAECYRPDGMKMSITYRPQAPDFAGREGGAPQLCQELFLPWGETVLSLPMHSQGAGRTTHVRVAGRDLVVEKGGEEYSAAAVFDERFAILSGDAAETLRRGLAGRDLQELWNAADEADGVPLAYVRLLRLGEQYMLDEVASLSERYRVRLPLLEESVERVLDCWAPDARPDPQPAPRPPQPKPLPDPPPQPAPQPILPGGRVATGVIELNTEADREEGDILLSDEVFHGLGPGQVYVSVGLEELYPVVNQRTDVDVLLGDPTLFARTGGVSEAAYDWGVRLRPEKGTFEIALRLRQPPRRTTLRLRWYAYLADAVPHRPDERGGILVGLDPGVSRLRPGESVCFTPVFETGRALPCEFSVEGRHSGSVTSDGRYTAPVGAGLFVVCAQVKGDPKSRARSYVIVTREGAAGSDAGQDQSDGDG